MQSLKEGKFSCAACANVAAAVCLLFRRGEEGGEEEQYSFPASVSSPCEG